MGVIHPCINFSPQHYAVCSIDGTGRAVAVMIGDVDPIWGHLLSWSSPPQPSIYSFHGVRNGEIFQEATNEIQINTNFESRNLLKKPKHQQFLKKNQPLSLSLFKNLRSQEKILSAWDLKEITLWSWSTYTPLQNHHLRVVMWAKTLRNATFQLVSPQPQRVESACVLQQRCLNLSRRGNICLGHRITCVSSLYRESI